ncbi:hypothetical protein, conserved [Eimeria brunetti]|uniref:Uncharacterized protein n=1 Tax=Eimeria brunetti TaxID=51314 RepID=U6LJH7_9EIME|nr:hypothetical protein, conserved [Eimeria brunetti]
MAVLIQCHSSHKKGTPSRPIHRVLSWREAELSSILEDCLDLSEELGFPQSFEQLSDSLATDPERKIAEFATMLAESAAAFQNEGGFKRAAPSHVFRNVFSVSEGDDGTAGALAQLASLLPVAAEGAAENAHLDSTEERRGAHLLLRMTAGSQGCFSGILPCITDAAEESEHPVRDHQLEGNQQSPHHFPRPSDTAFSSPSSESVLQVTTYSYKKECSMQEQQHMTGHRGAGVVATTPLASVSDAHLGASSSPPNNPEEHPFVRLPEIPQDAVPRAFASEVAFAGKLLQNSPMPIYITMRELFLKQSLNAEEAGCLLYNCELLINYGIHRLTTPLGRTTPFLVCRRLAALFMMFDYVVCTVQLIGAKMRTELWWSRFVKSFKMDRTLLSQTRGGRKGSGVMVNLAYRLIAALQIYSTGERPNHVEIIQLKRLIFSKLRSYSQFDHPFWKQWVHDDELYTGRPHGSS